jgi:hypothetical protein
VLDSALFQQDPDGDQQQGEEDDEDANAGELAAALAFMELRSELHAFGLLTGFTLSLTAHKFDPLFHLALVLIEVTRGIFEFFLTGQFGKPGPSE